MGPIRIFIFTFAVQASVAAHASLPVRSDSPACPGLIASTVRLAGSVVAEKLRLGALRTSMLSFEEKKNVVLSLLHQASDDKSLFYRVNRWADRWCTDSEGRTGNIASGLIKVFSIPRMERLGPLDISILNGSLRYAAVQRLLFRPSTAYGRDLTEQGEALKEALVRLALQAPLFTLERLREYKDQELGSPEAIFFGEVLRRVEKKMGSVDMFQQFLTTESMREPAAVDQKLHDLFSAGPIRIGVNARYAVGHDFEFLFRTPTFLSRAVGYFEFARSLHRDESTVEGNMFSLVDEDNYIAAQFIAGKPTAHYVDRERLSSGRTLYLFWNGRVHYPRH